MPGAIVESGAGECRRARPRHPYTRGAPGRRAAARARAGDARRSPPSPVSRHLAGLRTGCPSAPLRLRAPRPAPACRWSSTPASATARPVRGDTKHRTTPVDPVLEVEGLTKTYARQRPLLDIARRRPPRIVALDGVCFTRRARRVARASSANPAAASRPRRAAWCAWNCRRRTHRLRPPRRPLGAPRGARASTAATSRSSSRTPTARSIRAGPSARRSANHALVHGLGRQDGAADLVRDLLRRVGLPRRPPR